MPRWFSFFRGNPGQPAEPASQGGVPYWVARVERDPGDPFARRRAGEELFHRGDHEGAIAHWLGAADLYLGAGEVLRSLTVLGPALRLDPQNGRARMRLGLIARRDATGSRVELDASHESARRGNAAALFATLSVSELAAVVTQLDVRRFVAGEILLREGENATAVSILMDGVVRILGRKDGRTSFELGLLRPEDLFGLASVLEAVPSAATLEAEIPGELLVWPGTALAALCGELPGLRGALEAFRRAAAAPRRFDGMAWRARARL